MDQKTQTLGQIEKGRIIAILRGDYSGIAEEIVEAMLAAGVTAVEVTFNSPNVLVTIKTLATRFSERIAIGAGTVLKPEEVAQAADNGARFIVSPNMSPPVIERTQRLEMASFPGCFTPTEIVAAIDAGADAAKLFPASALGVEFVKALRGPLPDVRVVPTGGVTPELARQYLKTGAWALGVGSELVNKDVTSPGGVDRLHERAIEFVKAIHS
jgi:2-dehydro-3-deoxyphosphogluconate aldolase / (4S)-4-hydroxy-2-oxoglutarate aldolase